MNYDDTSFARMFSRYGGWRRVLTSSDFVLALAFALIGGIAVGLNGLGPAFVSASTVAFLTISAAMIATALAGLSIISSISDTAYVKFANKVKADKSRPDSNSLYENVIFVFWYAAIVAFISLFTDIVAALSTSLVRSVALANALAGLTLFFILYAVFAVALLLGVVTRWGVFHGMFIEAGSPEHPG